MTDTTTIALNKLLPWAGNVRKTDADKGIDELAASIAAHGLLQSLVVRKDRRGKYAVVAGRRRLLALKSLAEAETIDADRPIPCTVIAGERDASEISLAENVQRQPMHPADEFDAFKALIDGGIPVADVAARFGVTETVVKQRLKLANVSPDLIAAYRDGEMTLQHVMAFAVTDEHAAQERVWNQLPDWQKDNPEIIRDMLIADEVTADDGRVRFVTLKTYKKAGGAVRRDLFSQAEDGVFIQDVVLLESLVAKKLEKAGTKVRKEGWKWVEVRATFDYEEWSACHHLFPESAPLTPEQQEEIAALTAEADALAEIEELDDDQQARLDTINDRITELEGAPEIWPPESLAIAGAVVTLDRNGEVDIRCGYVRPEDAPSPSARADGVRSDKSKPGKPTLSASLIESLTAQRSAAIAAALLQQPDIALAALVHTLASPIFYGGARPDTTLQITSRTASLNGIEKSPAAQSIGPAEESWAARMPCNPNDLFTWCLTQATDTLNSLLTFCVARTVNAVIGKTDRPSRERLKHASMLAEALKLDMTAWFVPDAANYFGKISKAQIIEAVREATGATAPAWDAMKKAELAALAERKIAGTGWLPELLTAQAPVMTETVD